MLEPNDVLLSGLKLPCKLSHFIVRQEDLLRVRLKGSTTPERRRRQGDISGGGRGGHFVRSLTSGPEGGSLGIGRSL